MRASETTTPKHVWGIGLGGVAVGTLIIGIGRCYEGLSGYDQSVVVNIGTAIALIGPIYVAERALSRRIGIASQSADAAKVSADDARDAAGEALAQVGELSASVRQRLEDVRADDRDLRTRASTGHDQADLVALYDKAAGNNSIDRLGLRIPGPDPIDWWIRIRVAHRAENGSPVDLVELTFEDPDLHTVGQGAIWSPGEPVAEVFVRLAGDLHEAGAWPGDVAFDAEKILSEVTRALARVIDIRTGPRGDPRVRPIASLVGDSWAVTRGGLDSLRSADVFADANELVGDTHHAFQRLDQQVKLRSWNKLDFLSAFAEAERVHAAFARSSPGQFGMQE